MSEMLMIIFISSICTINFLMSKHPLSKGLNLLLHTIFISMISLLMNKNSWYSYILFLIMIGGLLILFIYMTSISSNEKFNINLKNLWMIPILFMIPIMLTIDHYYINKNFKIMSINQNFGYKIFETSMYKYIYYPNNFIMLMMIIYLLITLIAIVKITTMTYGPLRKK